MESRSGSEDCLVSRCEACGSATGPRPEPPRVGPVPLPSGPDTLAERLRQPQRLERRLAQVAVKHRIDLLEHIGAHLEELPLVLEPKPLLDGFDDSVSAPPTIIRIPGEGGLEELLARDGSEPLWPFNLPPAPDPVNAEGA